MTDLIDRLRMESAASDHGYSALADLLNEAADLLNEAADELANHVWRPIETAPRDGTGLLAMWTHWTAFPVRIWWQDNMWHMAEDQPATWYDGMPRDHGPTHWMPLPSPPEGKATP